MLWVPQKGIIRTVSNRAIVGAALPGTAVPSNSTTLLDGAVTEVIPAASNNQESWGLQVEVWGETTTSGAAVEGKLDVLIGGATDDILIDTLLIGGAQIGTTNAGVHSWFFPVHVPGGVRLAAVHASVRTSVNARVIYTLYGGSPPPWRVGRKVTTHGALINNCRGVAVTPATSGATASVTQIVASTTEDHFAVLPGFQMSVDSTGGARNLSVGIGVGAATEQRIGTWDFFTTSTEEQSGPNPGFPAFVDIPSGTRLTMLVSNSGTNNTNYDGLIYAVS